MYALQLQDVKEIINATEVTDIPGSVRSIEGTFALRNDIISVINGGELFNEEPCPAKVGIFVILEEQGTLVALHATSVVAVIKLENTIPMNDFLKTKELEIFNGYFKYESDIVLILNMNQIISDLLLPDKEKV